MNVKYFELDPWTTPAAQARNRNILRAGVETIGCTYVGPAKAAMPPYCSETTAYTPTQEQKQALQKCSLLLLPDEWLGTLEVYDNGAMNVFLRREGYPVAIGVFCVRPTVQEETHG